MDNVNSFENQNNNSNRVGNYRKLHSNGLLTSKSSDLKSINNQNKNIGRNLYSNILKNRINNIKNSKSNSSNNSNNKIKNEVASTALSTATGVPKVVTDAFVNSKLGNKAIEQAKKQNLALRTLDKLVNSSKKEKEKKESATTFEGFANFKLSLRAIKIALITSIPVFTIIIFCCLIITASNVIINSMTLGQVDLLNDPNADEKLDKIEGVFDNEITDEDYESFENNQNLTSFINDDIDTKYIQINKISYRPYQEADLDELEDFYGGSLNYGSDYDMDMVYTFFFKIYYIYQYYNSEYDGVKIDLPLLMATLNIQSTDKSVVFSSNIINYDKEELKKKEKNDRFSYDKKFNYQSTPTSSEYDIEVLVQNMFSYQVEEQCVDSNNKVIKKNILKDENIGTATLTCDAGQIYKTTEKKLVKDEEKYNEFLKYFLEKKYFLKQDDSSGTDTPNQDDSQSNNENNNNKPNDTSNGNWRNWTQCGQSWSNIRLGSGQGTTMCKVGCLVTSLSIQIARSGTYVKSDSFDPGVAAKYLSFTRSGALTNWNSITNIAPNFVPYARIYTIGMSRKAVINKILSYDSDKYYFILYVGKIGRGYPHHFVAVDYADKDANEIYILDPASDRFEKAYENYRIYRLDILLKKD